MSLFSAGENSFTHFPRNLCSEIAIRHKVSPLSNALKKKKKKASSYLLSIIVDFPKCFITTFRLASVLFGSFVPYVSCGISCSATFTFFACKQEKKVNKIADIHEVFGQQKENPGRDSTQYIRGPCDARGAIILL